ncbi:hypothetical protein [Hansschlegelia zhihuaiae]|uniref:Uncharacterized protein n=1 Tax=Hansschlegelia zhihuaiae TaxID=405005 RepID=A0A4Q0MA19_9HYPH|nr:hypothetical protein [Hansschlegelia zhihuaiae]RXF69935.1 hypothetical protein EK403_17510 [Hansschlegelia zhihuaiae]
MTILIRRPCGELPRRRPHRGDEGYLPQRLRQHKRGLASVFSAQWPDAKYRGVVQKATMVAGGVSAGKWGSALVDLKPLAETSLSEFRALTAIGRLQGVRPGPFNTPMAMTTAGTPVGWMGKGNQRPSPPWRSTAARSHRPKSAGPWSSQTSLCDQPIGRQRNAGVSLADPHFVMHAIIATNLASLDVDMFRGVGPFGGEIKGIPVG